MTELEYISLVWFTQYVFVGKHRSLKHLKSNYVCVHSVNMISPPHHRHHKGDQTASVTQTFPTPTASCLFSSEVFHRVFRVQTHPSFRLLEGCFYITSVSLQRSIHDWPGGRTELLYAERRRCLEMLQLQQEIETC